MVTQATVITDPNALARRMRKCDNTITDGWPRIDRHNGTTGAAFTPRLRDTNPIATAPRKLEGGVSGFMTKARQVTNPAANSNRSAAMPDKLRSSLPTP